MPIYEELFKKYGCKSQDYYIPVPSFVRLSHHYGYALKSLPFLVVSFYTKNTPYEDYVHNLKESLDKFGIAYDIRAIDNAGGWHLNCCRQTFFIRRMIDLYKDEYVAIVWLDSDAIVMRYPSFLQN